MKKVEIYTSMMCGFCHRAKSLLSSKGVSFIEIDVSMDPQKRAEMVERTKGARSVPQIIIADMPIGGYDNLKELSDAGKLDALLYD